MKLSELEEVQCPYSTCKSQIVLSYTGTHLGCFIQHDCPTCNQKIWTWLRTATMPQSWTDLFFRRMFVVDDANMELTPLTIRGESQAYRIREGV